MWGRWGRVVGVYAALGVVWWASVGLAYRAISCDGWECLYPMLGAQVAISVVLLAGAGVLLRLAGVTRAGPAAWTAGGLVMMAEVGQRFVPVWPDGVPDVVRSLAAFTTAALVAAVATERAVTLWARAALVLAAAAVLPLRLAWLVTTGEA
ncbi:hypothetical protein [Nonomuraea typhae]|uniref:Uncharacterized protein n=1 Tax=Nonomuraea typhae TaxID=2603600 RepID=A0ABW7ZCP5_9ACTN